MNGLNLLNGHCCYLEIGPERLRALNGSLGLELPLERLPNGRLTPACKEKLGLKLAGFFKKEPWQPRPRAWCAIGARGVLLRRLSLPTAGREEVARLLPLQLEKELPLSPEELAWGYRPLSAGPTAGNGSGTQHEFLVAAVRKEVVEDYAQVLCACELNPSFTLGALARSYLCAHPPRAYMLLELGSHQSELICFADGAPVAVRVVPWGGQDIVQALAEKLALGPEEAQRLKSSLEQTPGAAPENQAQVQAALEQALEKLAGLLDGPWAGQRLYLSGHSARNKELVSGLARRLPRVAGCEVIEPTAAEGRSAAVLGLKAAAESRSQPPPLFLQVKPGHGAAAPAQPAQWKWVGLAAVLALAVLAMPYLEAALFKPRLARKLAALKAERGRLPLIDQELEFLQYLQQNQPPYLDTLYLLGKAAPQEARLESLSIDRRGQLSLRGTMKDSSQVAEFRKQLIDSGLFASLTVEEQTPSPDRRKLSVRMSGQWKPLAQRRALALGPSAEEIQKAKTRVREQPGMPPMMPGGMPPMMSMPGPGMPGMSGMSSGSHFRVSSSHRSVSGPMPGGMTPSGSFPSGGLPPGFPSREGVGNGARGDARPPSNSPSQP